MLARFLHRAEPISLIGLLSFLVTMAIFYFIGINESGTVVYSFLEVSGIVVFNILLMIFYDYLFQKYHLSPPNHYAIFVYVILIGLFPSVLEFSKVTVSNLFIIFSLSRILSLRKKDNLLSKLFDSGFLMGISYLIYPPNVVFLLMVYIGYFVYIRIIDKRLLIPLISFSIPIFLIYTYFLFTENLALFKTLTEINFNSGFRWFYDWKFSIPFLLLSFILLVAVLKILSTSAFSKLEEERNYKIIIAYLILVGIIILINGLEIKENIFLVYFPTSIIVGNSLNLIKKEWFKELIFYIMLITTLIFFFS
jgi:hypothetical protein